MKVVAQNRRAKFDYEVTETIEAGLVLTGQEVKSCRLGQVNLAGAYVSFAGAAPLLKQAKISPYKFAGNIPDYEPGRERQLLLSRRDIDRLRSAFDEKGVAIIPLEIRAGKFIKVLLGLGRGRKRLDKRQRIKSREMDRQMRRGGDV